MEEVRKTHEKAVAFLKALDIKKATVGGFNKIATFEAFKEFSALYEKILSEERMERRELEDEIRMLKERAVEKDKEAKSLQESLSLLSQKAENAADKEKDIADALSAARADLAAERSALESLRRTVNDERSSILGEARAEADRISREGQEAALKYKAAVMEDVKKVQQEKALILGELEVIESQIASIRRSPEVSWPSHE